MTMDEDKKLYQVIKVNTKIKKKMKVYLNKTNKLTGYKFGFFKDTCNCSCSPEYMCERKKNYGEVVIGYRLYLFWYRISLFLGIPNDCPAPF